MHTIVCSLEHCIHASCYASVCSLELCTHASCYATVCSLELCTHASCTLSYVLLSFALMGRYATVCSHASLYAAVCSLELCTHASCYATFSWTLHSWVMLSNPPWYNMCSCGAGVQAYRVQILKGSWKNCGRCSNQKTAKHMWRQFFSGWPENQKIVVSCRRNHCFRSTACESGVHDLKNKFTQILIGTSTSNMINSIPLIKKNKAI